MRYLETKYEALNGREVHVRAGACIRARAQDRLAHTCYGMVSAPRVCTASASLCIAIEFVNSPVIVNINFNGFTTDFYKQSFTVDCYS